MYTMESSLFINTKGLQFVPQKAVMFEIKLQEDRMQGEGEKEAQETDEENEVNYH